MYSKVVLLCAVASLVCALPPQGGGGGWWGGASFNPWFSWLGGGTGANPWAPAEPAPPANPWLPWLQAPRQTPVAPQAPAVFGSAPPQNPFAPTGYGSWSPWAPKWAPCSTIGSDCLDCKTKVVCTKIGGIQSACSDPLLPYCNQGQCSATPGAGCGGPAVAVPANSGLEFPADEYTK